MPDLVPLTQGVYNVTGPTQVVTYTATAASSTAVGAQQVLLVSTTDCHIDIEDVPAADTNSFFIPAKVPMAFTCQGTNSVSVIQDSANGKLYVTPIN